MNYDTSSTAFGIAPIRVGDLAVVGQGVPCSELVGIVGPELHSTAVELPQDTSATITIGAQEDPTGSWSPSMEAAYADMEQQMIHLHIVAGDYFAKWGEHTKMLAQELRRSVQEVSIRLPRTEIPKLSLVVSNPSHADDHHRDLKRSVLGKKRSRWS